jgi:succinyl-diaminopimelate desuccinylase
MLDATALEAIVRAIDEARPAMAALLAKLVSIPTENPPATVCLDCVAALESALDDLGFVHERIEIESPPDAPRAAVRAWVGQAGPVLHFHGHYDVVPAFARDQFVPHVEDDVMFGRGSSDMKSGLVSMIFAAHALKAVGASLRGRIALLFVPDEETGGTYGSAALAARGELGANGVGMLLPEPTSGVVWNANRGAITLEVTVHGRSAHVGLARHGVNAVGRAIPLIGRLFEMATELDRDRDSVLLVGGRVDAGSNFNVVPDRCTFTIDRRVNPDEDYEAEKRRLLDAIDRARREGAQIDVRVIQEGRSAATPQTSRLAEALAVSIVDITGETAAFETCPGLLEIRFYVERGVPALAYGPGILAVSHGPKEFVRISRMVDCAKVYALTALRTIGDLAV